MTELVSATVAAVQQNGVDSVSLSDVASRAGVSRPTAYSLVGSAEGAMAELWTIHGRSWIEKLSQPDSADRPPSGRLRTTLTDLTLAAPRHPELLEVLRRDANDMWRRCEKEGESHLLRFVYAWATEIGAEASKKVSRFVGEGRSLLSIVDSLPNDARTLVGLKGKSWKPSGAFAKREYNQPEGDDEVTNRLLNAAIDVVVASGVAQASMLRICRVAGVTTGAGRPRFETIDDLILDTFEIFIGGVVDENLRAVVGGGASQNLIDLYAELVVAGLADDRAKWRRFRQEMYVAARSNSAFHRALKRSVGESEADMEKGLSSPGVGLRPAAVHRLLGLNQILAVGIPALHAVGLPVHELDHRVPLRWIYRT